MRKSQTICVHVVNASTTNMAIFAAFVPYASAKFPLLEAFLSLLPWFVLFSSLSTRHRLKKLRYTRRVLTAVYNPWPRTDTSRVKFREKD